MAAEWQPTIDCPLFQGIEEEIHSLFNQLIERVMARRDQLMRHLYEKWSAYERQILRKESTIRDVEKMRERMEIVSIEDNRAAEIQRASVVTFREEIQSLQEKADPPNLCLYGYLTEELLDQVDKLGEFFEYSESESQPTKRISAIDYKNKKRAVLTIGTKGTKGGHFNRPSRIYIDERAKRLYVPDSENMRVQVVNITGEYVSQFGQGEMKFPVSVTTDLNYVYVSDNAQDCILRYRLSNLKFVNNQLGTPGGSSSVLKLPRGITVSPDNEVMVADNNNRICVFSCELNFISEFGKGQLVFPQSLQIKNNKIFVLDCSSPCLHIFNESRDKIRSMITRGFMRQVRDAVSFCFDHDENILIADNGAKRLKVFSPEAEAIHSIGNGIAGTEDIGVCWGVAVTGTKIFVAGRSDDNHFVKVF